MITCSPYDNYDIHQLAGWAAAPLDGGAGDDFLNGGSVMTRSQAVLVRINLSSPPHLMG